MGEQHTRPGSSRGVRRSCAGGLGQGERGQPGAGGRRGAARRRKKGRAAQATGEQAATRGSGAHAGDRRRWLVLLRCSFLRWKKQRTGRRKNGGVRAVDKSKKTGASC
uniref:Uncharacterized protein n=1 Tax=Setaria italica TaxID=4555 RepID=K3ZPD3_SETIT